MLNQNSKVFQYEFKNLNQEYIFQIPYTGKLSISNQKKLLQFSIAVREHIMHFKYKLKIFILLITFCVLKMLQSNSYPGHYKEYHSYSLYFSTHSKGIAANYSKIWCYIQLYNTTNQRVISTINIWLNSALSSVQAI